MNSLITEKFKVNIISPVVMQGASNNPEIRINSLRGVLRWWLRASIFPQSKVQEIEENIFGSNSKASSIKFKLSSVNNLKTCKVNDKGKAWEHPLFYFNYNIRNRFAFSENQSFEFCVLFGNQTNNELNDLLINSICLLSALGGIGARSRRGYGSIALEYLGQTESIKNRFDMLSSSDVNVYTRNLKNLLETIANGQAILGNNYCHITNLSVYIDTGKSQNGYLNYQDALSSVIQQMQSIRGNKKTSGYNSHIKPLLQAFIGNRSLNTNNIKIENFGFGLPLNYQSRSLKNQLNAKSVEALFEAKDFERMASPLLIKISKQGNKYYPIISYFNNMMIQNGMDISIKLSEKYYDRNRNKIKKSNGTLNCKFISNIPQSIREFLESPNFKKIF